MNEGFRALPQHVQRQILGKAGGGVMQRPLFRQMGGPAEPMPQDMSQSAQQEGEMLGQEIAARTQESIDAATDVEGAINALRGNDMPLDARYQELAGLVGERDAMQTPESVLALTQPAIMMTQQGAMDSGIGELMQAVAGDTQMDQGMDQGLGALMMQGAGSTPPENFRRGGPVMVRKFQDGTPPTGNSSVPTTMVSRVPGIYEGLLPLAQGIYGTDEERRAEFEKDRQMARSQLMFDLAGAGLAFAGETEGGSVAERLANALNRTQLTDRFAQRAAQVRAAEKELKNLDQQARATAFGLAVPEASAQTRAAEGLEEALKTMKPTNPDELVLYTVDAAGLPAVYKVYNKNNPQDFAQYQKDSKSYYTKETIKPFITAAETAKRLTVEIEQKGLPVEFYEVQADKKVRINGETYDLKAGSVIAANDVQFADFLEKGVQFAPRPQNSNYQTFYKKDGSDSQMVDTNSALGKQWLTANVGEDGLWTDNSAAFDQQFEDPKTQVVFRKVTPIEGEPYYERKEVFVSSQEGNKKFRELIEEGPSEDDFASYSGWSTDRTLVDAYMAEQKSITALMREREGQMQLIDLTDDITLDDGLFYAKGPQLVNKNELIALQKKAPANINTAVITEKDVYQKTGFMLEELKELRKEDENLYRAMMGVPVLTDKDFLLKYNMTMDEFLALDKDEQMLRAGMIPEITMVNLTNPDTGETVSINTNENGARIVINGLLDEGYVESGLYSKDTAEKTNGFVTTKSIVVDGQEIPANTFVELTNQQVLSLKDPTAVRSQLTGSAKTLLKTADGTPQIVNFMGGNFYDVNGKPIDFTLPEYQNAIILGENNTYESVKNARRAAEMRMKLAAVNAEAYIKMHGSEAYKKLEENLGKEGVKEMFGDLGGPNLIARSIDMAAMAREGIGPYAKLREFANALTSLTPGSWGWRNMFEDTVQARAWVDALNVSVRIALAATPRISEGEQVRLGKSIPSTEQFLKNPEAAIAELLVLRKRLLIERDQNYKTIGSSTNAQTIKRAEEQNFAIDTFLDLMHHLPDEGYIDTKLVDEANDRIGGKD